MIILGRNPGILQAHTNTEDRTQDEYMVASMFKKAEISFRQEGISEDPGTTSTSSGTSEQTAQEVQVEVMDQGCKETTNDALEYIAGYIAKKYKHKYPTLGSYTYKTDTEHDYRLPSWVQHLSYGGLIKPSENWLEQIKEFDKMFKKYHDDGNDDASYKKGKNITKKLVKKINKKHNDVHIELIKTFIRLRTIIRIKYVNYKKSQLKKRKANEDNDDRRTSKKMKKLLN